MKEIKFRLWDKLGNKIVTPNKNIYLNLLGQVVTDNPENGEIIPFKNDTYELSQFTGLQDVNGKEVYEGDIVRASYSIMQYEISKVEFKRGIFFVLKNGRYHPLSEFMYNSNDRTKDIEIIGNIYENPELLHEEN